MKYICLFLAIVGINASVLGKEHFEFSSFTVSSKTATLEGENVRVTLNQNTGTEPTWHSRYGEAMLYSGNTLVVTPKNGKTITRIAYTYKEYEGSGHAIPTIASVVGNDGEHSRWNSTTHNWTGSANTSVTLTLTGTAGHLGFSSLEISYEEDNDPGDPYGNANNSAMDHISLRTPVAPIIITTTEANGSIDFRLDGANLYQYGGQGYTLNLQDGGVGNHSIWYFSGGYDYGYEYYNAQFVADFTLYYEFTEAGTDNMSFTASAYGTDGSTEYVLTIPVQVTYVADGPFSVTYDANEATSGSVPTDENEYHHGDNATVLGNTGTLARTGYKWIGWNTQANAHGTHYDAEDELTIDYDNVTLYAEWTTASSITLDANGHGTNGSAIGVKGEPIESFVGVTPDDGYTVDGYWTTDDNSGVCILSREGLTMMQESSYTTAEGNWNVTTANVTLYAHYALRYTGHMAFCARTIEFDKNGQDAATNWPDDITGLKRGYVVPETKSAAVRATNPSVVGASFQGWYKEAECNNEWNWETDVVGTGDVTTLYAKWEVAKVNVTYHHAGADHVEPVDYNAHPAGFTPDACAAADRVFVGWSVSEVAMQDAEPTLVDPTTFSITADKHFYAVYASKNGGKTGLEVVLATEDFGTMPDDWSFSANAGRNATNPFTAQLDYLVHNTTTVSYVKSNDKFADMSKIMLDAYITGGCTAHKFAVQYSTDGENWNTIGEKRLNANTVWYRDQTFMMPSVQDAYVRIVTVPSDFASVYSLYVDNIKVYTKRRTFYYTDYSTSCEMAASMTLTYDAQGGSAQTAVTEAGWVTLPTGAECERGCYTLTGWLCSGDGETYEPGAQYLFNHDVTMTAQWSVNSSAAVTVTYHTGLEGAETVTVENVHCGDILTEGQVPTPAGCGQNVFVGWAIGEFADAATKDGIAQYAVGTDVVMGDMELHAIWKQGTSVFTKYFETDVVAGTYILVDPSTSKALSATLVPTPVTIDGTTITTDEHFIQWTVAKVGEQFSILGMDGYLTITADKTNALGISNSAVETWNMKESSTNGVYNIGITFDASDRRVCYNSTKDKWLSYKNRTSGNLYKLSGDGPATFTMDGVCPHIYHATGVSEMTSGTGVSVMAKENGMIIVENTSVVPVAQKVSGDDVFEVTVNPTSTGTNGDGSLNYAYSVKFTPTAGNQTYSAVYKFIGTDETEDEKHIASEEITFTGYSLPDEFAIVVNRGGQYYALPGDATSAGNPDAIQIDVEEIDGMNVVMNLDETHRYSVYTGTRTSELRSTVRLKTASGALWATNAAEQSTIQDYTGSLTDNTNAANIQTQWTLERVYRESDDEFMGYHLISDANKDKGLFYSTYGGASKWGYYNESYYTGATAYYGNIQILPIVEEIGAKMDIVDWTNSSVTLNMNGSTRTVTIGSETKNKNDREADRTMVIPVSDLTTDGFIRITGKNASTSTIESQCFYKVPHIMTSSQTIGEPEAATFSATSILYVKSGTITVSAQMEIAKVIVCPGAALNVTGSIRCGELIIRTTPWESGSVEGNVVTANTYYTRIIAKQDAYYHFALPYESNVDNVFLSNHSNAPYGNTWILKSYDGARRANSGADGQNWTLLDGTSNKTIAATTGYEMFSNSGYYREFYFPVTPTDNKSVSLVAHSGAAGEAHEGWNAVCSPIMSNYQPSFSQPSEALKISELVDLDVYWQHIPTWIAPAIPFYVQTETDKPLLFDNSSWNSPARVVEEEVAEQWLQLNYTPASGRGDETNIFVHPNFTAAYETGKDVAKQTLTGKYPVVYVSLACGNLAFAAVPDDLAADRIPLTVYAPQAAEMTFSLADNAYLDRLDNLYLVDEQDGAMIDLLDSDYTYSAEQGTTSGRFYLVAVFRAPQVPTDWQGADGGGIDVKKIIYKDHMYILRDGHIWDANGKRVK